MTLAPLVNPTIHGVKGKPVELGFWCQAPDCGQPAQQRHHIWPKSFLRGQPQEWVSVNGVVIANTCGLCIPHHNEVTGSVGGHIAKLVWNEGLQVLEWWETDDREWRCLGLLRSHEDSLLLTTEAEVEPEKEWLCPSCGKPKAKKIGKPRNTKSWTVQVPDEEAENGAAVLDEYVDDFSVAMGWGDESKGVRRYHVIVNVFAWLETVKPEFLADWEEAMSD